MNKMPLGWEMKPLGDICKIIGGGTPSKENEIFYKGNIPWATVRDMKTDLISKTEYRITPDAVNNSSTNIIKGGNVVIATRVGLGKVCIVQQDTAINQDLRGIIPIWNKKIDTKYLFFWFKCITKKIQEEGTGATVKGVKLPFVKSLKIPLPPLIEQKRIVAILDEAFAGISQAIANTERNLKNARELFTSQLIAEFSTVKREWPNNTLSGLCTFTSGGTPSKNNPSFWDGTIPWVSGKDMKTEIMKDAILHISQNAIDQSATKIAPVGSLLILVRGMGLANGIHVAEVISPCAFNQDIKAIHPSDSINSRFLLLAIKSNCSDASILLERAAHGTLKINSDNLHSISVPVPPISIQMQISVKLDQLKENVENLKAIYQQKLAALAELKQSILQKAFTGQLTDNLPL